MNPKKLNKLTKKYIEIVTKDFDEPIKKTIQKKNSLNNIQEGGGINANDTNNTNNRNNIISISEIINLNFNNK